MQVRTLWALGMHNYSSLLCFVWITGWKDSKSNELDLSLEMSFQMCFCIFCSFWFIFFVCYNLYHCSILGQPSVQLSFVQHLAVKHYHSVHSIRLYVLVCLGVTIDCCCFWCLLDSLIVEIRAHWVVLRMAVLQHGRGRNEIKWLYALGRRMNEQILCMNSMTPGYFSLQHWL